MRAQDVPWPKRSQKKLPIEPDEFASRLSVWENLAFERDTLRRHLKKAYEWIPVVQALDPKVDVRELIESIQERLKEIDEQQMALRLNGGEPRRRTTLGARSFDRTFYQEMFQDSPWEIPNSRIMPGIAPRSLRLGNCDPIEGSVGMPTDVHEYLYESPSFGDDGWTRGGTDFNPITTGAPRIEFEAFATKASPSGLNLPFPSFAFSGPNKLGTIFCFQYTFPPAPCNVILDWSTTAFGIFPNGVFLEGEYNSASIDFVFAEQSFKGGFPGFGNLIWSGNEHRVEQSSGPFKRFADLSGSIEVQEGNEARVYIGLSLDLWVPQGQVCLGKDCTTAPDESLSDHGIFMCLIPSTTGWPGIGLHYVMNSYLPWLNDPPIEVTIPDDD